MTKVKDYTFNFLVFFTGMISSDLFWHFRFNNDLLRRELLIFMRDGNDYFLGWFLGSLPFLLIVWGIFIGYYYVYLPRKRNYVKEVGDEHGN